MCITVKKILGSDMPKSQKCRAIYQKGVYVHGYNNDPSEQELINRLEIPEQKAIRKLTILLFSMENFFKRTAEDIKRKCDVFQIWEERNRMDWNEWYHTQADLLEEEINGYSFEYAYNSKHGWCL